MPESGKTKSAWTDVERPEYPELKESLRCDVLVVGAGISGLSCAYMLARAGKNVIVVDGARVCAGETQRTTAHISDLIDDSYQEVEGIYGEENMRLVKDSLTASIAKIEEIIASEKIDCDFSRLDAYLFLAPGCTFDPHKEREAGLKAGFEEIEFIEALPQVTHHPQALRYPSQAQFHVVKYLNGLCKALDKMGVKIFQNSRVEKVEPKAEVDGEKMPRATFKNKETIAAADIVIATNGPIIDFTIQTKQSAFRTFVIALKIEKGRLPRALYWDTKEPYHYARLAPIDSNDREELLVVGGEDHRVGEENDAEERFAKLINWTKQTFDIEGEVVYSWSGQVYEPTDILGFIGQDPELGKHVYVATGDSGMGITNGTVAGMLLTDLIMGKKNPWTEVYSPARQTIKALGNYISENAHNLSHYKDLVLAKTVAEADIPFGEGALIEQGGKKLAVYRDESGGLTKVSPYCTHLQGVVCWNSCESSWDCPVHGSRFTATGEVIYGPADGDLEPRS
jgi:glycine/D-amino acid oxidase-like deaminating enzyme/nitrite reductase/ring-hydroxylating ferredoxin subunit